MVVLPTLTKRELEGLFNFYAGEGSEFHSCYQRFESLDLIALTDDKKLIIITPLGMDVLTASYAKENL